MYNVIESNVFFFHKTAKSEDKLKKKIVNTLLLKKWSIKNIADIVWKIM